MNAITPAGKTEMPQATATAAAYLPMPAGLPELRELRSFAVAARTGNIGRAARQLNVTAAAISQQLHKLEDTLGAQLLIRHSRGVSTTPAGRELLRRADAILRLLQAPLDRQRSPAIDPCTISVALPAEYAPLLAAPLLEAARHRFPGATLAIAEGRQEMLQDVCSGQVDIALLQDTPRLEELLVERLLTEDLGVVCAPDHPLAASAQPLRLRDLLAAALVLPDPRHWIRRLLARAEAQRGFRFDIITEVDGVPAIVAMVRHGPGCTVLPAAAVRAHAPAGALAFRPLTHPALAVTHAIAVRRDAAPAIVALAAQAAEAIRATAAGGAWPCARLLRAASTSVHPRQGALPDSPGMPAAGPMPAEGG